MKGWQRRPANAQLAHLFVTCTAAAHDPYIMCSQSGWSSVILVDFVRIGSSQISRQHQQPVPQAGCIAPLQ